jgi:hypothetical protein
MKVTLGTGYNITVEVERELHQKVKEVPDSSNAFATAFKTTYPHMKRMDPSFFDLMVMELKGSQDSEFSINSMKFWKLLHQYHQKQLKKKTEFSKRPPTITKTIIDTLMSQPAATPSAYSLIAGLMSNMFGFPASRDDVEKFVNEAKAAADATVEDEKPAPKAKATAKPKGRKKAEETPTDPLVLTLKRDATPISHFVCPSRDPTKEEREAVSEILGVTYISKDEAFKIKKSVLTEELIEALGASDKFSIEGFEVAEEPKAKSAKSKGAAKGVAKPKGAAKGVIEDSGATVDDRGKLVSFKFKDGKTRKLVLIPLMIKNKSVDFVYGCLNEETAKKSKELYAATAYSLRSELKNELASKYEMFDGDVASEALYDDNNADTYNVLVEAGIITANDGEDVNEDDAQ